MPILNQNGCFIFRLIPLMKNFPRNVFYLAYCIPSSCLSNDLKESLSTITINLNKQLNNLRVVLSENPINCQINEEQKIDSASIIFM